MNLKLKSKIEEAINKVLQDVCEDPSWDHYIYPDLTRQMTDAAEAVFDAAQLAQKYMAEQET